MPSVRTIQQSIHHVFGIARSKLGTPVPLAKVTVTDVVAGGQATVYSDEFLTTVAAQPLTCGADGRYDFYVGPGKYTVSFAGNDSFEAVEEIDVGGGLDAPRGTYAPMVGGRLPAIKVVAAVDAPAAVKAAADYVCDGVADDVEINAAIAAAGPGGMTWLTIGNFTIAAPMNMNQHGMAFIGSAQGRGTAFSSDAGQTNQVKLANGANCNMITVGDVRKTYLGFMYLDGNKANNVAASLDQTFADGVITGTTTLTSATAAFTQADIGRTITGTGIPGGTTITAVAVGQVTVCTLSQAATNASGVSFTVVGRSLTNAGISAIANNAGMDFHAQYIYLFNVSGHGVDIQGTQCTLDHVYPESGASAGLHVWGTAAHLRCYGLVSAGNAQQGILDESSGGAGASTSNNIVGNCYMGGEVLGAAAFEGITLAYGTGKRVIGMEIGGAGHEAIRLVGGIKGTVIDDVAVYNCGRATNNTYDAITMVQGADGLWPATYSVDNVSFYPQPGGANKPRYLVNDVNAAAGPGTVRGCMAAASSYSTAFINKVNSATTVRNNPGYVNEATGTATVASGTTSIVVTHGLSLTPSIDKINLTKQGNPTNAVTSIWVSNITSTQFTINTNADPGAGGLAVSWQVVA